MSGENKFVYDPSKWDQCAVAYWKKVQDSSIELSSGDESSIDWDKDIFKREDGTYPEVVNFLFTDELDTQRISLIEGINLTEFDPSTPGGWGFWSEVFNTENLRELAKQHPEEMAFGKWDILRQIINMGQIAFMAKLNAAMKVYASSEFDEDTTEKYITAVLGELYWKKTVESINQLEEQNAG